MSSVVSEPAPAGAAAPVAQSAGSVLREARQQRGLHIGALAAMLKVPQSKLEALEADRWQDLPDMTFARALAKSMCGVLKIDAAPVLTLLPRSGERELDVSAGLNQPYRERGARSEGLSLAWLQRPVVWAPVLLLLAAAGVYTMPTSWFSLPQATTESTTTETAARPIQAAPAPEVSASTALAGGTGANEPAASPASMPGVAAATVPAPAATTPPPQQLAVQATAAPAAASIAVAPVAPVAGLVPVALKASADSWVEIVDARGQTLISKLLRGGEAQELAGKPPLKVTVGNVAGTQLSLRGAAVDLAAQSRDNVARIELN